MPTATPGTSYPAIIWRTRSPISVRYESVAWRSVVCQPGPAAGELRYVPMTGSVLRPPCSLAVGAPSGVPGAASVRPTEVSRPPPTTVAAASRRRAHRRVVRQVTAEPTGAPFETVAVA